MNKLTVSQRRALDITHEQWLMVYEALAQYAENQNEHAELTEESEGRTAEMAKADAAYAVLERFDAVFIELAEEGGS